MMRLGDVIIGYVIGLLKHPPEALDVANASSGKYTLRPMIAALSEPTHSIPTLPLHPILHATLAALILPRPSVSPWLAVTAATSADVTCPLRSTSSSTRYLPVPPPTAALVFR